MANKSIQLEQVEFIGPDKLQVIKFADGVNVICGAPDTGKSIVAEAIDFIFGGSTRTEISERIPHDSASMGFNLGKADRWKVKRNLPGGNFQLSPLTASCVSTSANLKHQFIVVGHLWQYLQTPREDARGWPCTQVHNFVNEKSGFVNALLARIGANHVHSNVRD